MPERAFSIFLQVWYLHILFKAGPHLKDSFAVDLAIMRMNRTIDLLANRKLAHKHQACKYKKV